MFLTIMIFLFHWQEVQSGHNNETVLGWQVSVLVTGDGVCCWVLLPFPGWVPRWNQLCFLAPVPSFSSFPPSGGFWPQSRVSMWIFFKSAGMSEPKQTMKVAASWSLGPFHQRWHTNDDNYFSPISLELFNGVWKLRCNTALCFPGRARV